MGRQRPRLSRLLAWLLSALFGGGALGAAQAQVAAGALPTGGQVVVGSGHLQQRGSVLVVQQSSARLGLDWASFNIGSGATVEFRQPDAGAIALNRVLGNDASQIYGSLKANGQVFLTNPNGVLFAPGARVDVGGLVASTLDLSQQNFADGRFYFTSPDARRGSGGAVVNQGSLKASAGGYLALFGNQVDNRGRMAVDAGSVVLASGRAATVSISGSGLISAVVTPGAQGSIRNSGSISADGGTVVLSAQSAQDIAASLVNNSGIVRANTLLERGGEVWITGDTVATSGHISAAAPAGGDAGRIVLVADLKHGQTSVGGTLDASAAAGRGGFIETSAARVTVADGARVSTAAPRSQTGTWLVDPVDFTIAASGGDMTGAQVAAALAGNNFTVASSQGASGTAGNLNVNDGVSWAANRLTLNAFKDININAPLTGTGSASLALDYGQGAVAAGNAGSYAVNAAVTLPAGNRFSTRLGSNGSAVAYTVVTTLAGLQAIDGNAAALASNYALGADIDASSTAAANGGLGFNPIGDQTNGSTSLAFSGRFDGLGHGIADLTINRPASAYVGLFATTSNASISNLVLVRGAVTGGGQTGGLIGYASGTSTLKGVRSGAAVSGSASVGGLIGQALGTGAVTFSSSSGSVTGTGASSGNVGGLIGYATLAGGLHDVSASGTVSGGYAAGGLVGYYASSGSIGNARADGAVSGTGTVGGLIGYAQSAGGSLTDATATGAVSAGANNGYVGGLVGQFAMTGGLTRGTASGAVGGGYYTGGLVGYLTSGSVTTASATGSVAGGYYSGGLVGYFSAAASMSYGQASGAVSGGTVTGGLVGYFTGNGISFSNASGTVQGGDYVGGLVGYVNSGGDIVNANAAGQVSGTSEAGGLLGRWGYSGSLTDSGATGAVTGGSRVGGLVGYGYNNTGINNGTATGRVTGSGRVGGLVGDLVSTGVSVSSATGNVVATGNSTVYAGGLIGSFSHSQAGGQIGNSTATGSVFADAPSAQAGGLVGDVSAGSVVYSSSFTNTPATGNVTVTDSASSSSSSHYAGGLVGYFSGDSIVGGKASGNVAGRTYTGGLVGYYYGTAGLSGGSASGNVLGTTTAGGLVGYYNAAASLSNGSASGNVTATAAGGAGNAAAGGLVGQYNGSAPLTAGSASGRVTATGNSSVAGGLVGELDYAGITGGTASGRVTATGTNARAGGLVGWAQPYYTNATISSSVASGDVSGTQSAGGLVGYLVAYTYNTSSRFGIAGSSASGAVSGGTYAGGLVGYYDGLNGYAASDAGISTSKASGAVQSAQFAGGLAGYFQGFGGIQDSGASGAVTGTGGTAGHYLGGLAGYFVNRNSTAGAGALVRSWASGSVSLPTAATLASTTDVYAGGLAGLVDGYSATSVTVADAYATGAVTLAATTVGRLYAGGLLGSTDSSLARTYATGAVSASGGSSRSVGGLVAVRSTTSATATSSYWASDASGQPASALGTAKTLAQLKDTATFTGWDLSASGGSSAVWRVYQGQAAPLLRGLLTPLTVALADVSRPYDGSASLAGAVLAGGAAYAANPHPERIVLSGVSANVGSYAFTPASVYSVQTGYDLAVTGSGTLTIGQRQLTLGTIAASKVYDGTTAATLNAAAQPGNLVAGEDLVLQPGSGFALQFADKAAGTGKLVNVIGSYSYADGARGRASNYALPTATVTSADIAKATLNAGSFSATSRVYDGTTTVAVSAQNSGVTGVLGNDSVGVDLSSVTSGTAADKTVGTGKAVTVLGASLTGADAGNYTLAGIGGVLVDITPKAGTVNGITASNKTYDASTTVYVDAGAAQLSGIVGGDQVQVRTNGLTGTTATKDVGDGKAVTVTGLGLRGPDAANYSTQQGAVSVNVSQANLTAYLSGTASKVYDGTTSANVQLYGLYIYGSDNVTLTAASIGYTSKNVAFDGNGNVAGKPVTATGVVLAGSDAGNYHLTSTTSNPINGVISPKPLTVSGIAATNRVYDGTRDVVVNVAGATVNSGGIVAGDSAVVSIPGSGTVTGQLATKDAGTAKAVTVPGLGVTGTDAANYTLNASGSGVTVNIAKRNLTATYTSTDKVYDGNVYAVVRAASSDIVAGDAVVLYTNAATNNGQNETSYARYADKNVGSAKAINILYEALYSGADIGNYTLVNAATAAGNGGIYGSTASSITPKPVTLAFNGVNKVYDGTTAATVALIYNYSGASDPIYGDTLTTTQTAVYTGANAKNVGSGKPINVTGIVLGGADAANYTVANTTATVNNGVITAKPVTLSGITATSRPYDNTTIVAVSASNVGSAGFVAGDAVAVLANNLSTGTVASKNVGNNKPVTVAGLSLTGADAGNYSINLAASGITADITPKVLAPVFLPYSRPYDGLTGASLVFDSTDIYAGDRSVVSVSQQAVFTGSGAKNAGSGKPVAVTGLALHDDDGYGNYTLASTTASATGSITPKAVTPTFTGVARVYNGVADTSATVLGASAQLIQGDDARFVQTARFTGDGAAGTGKAVAVGNVSLAGNDASNYSVAGSAFTTTADITRRALGVTGIAPVNRAYDGSTVVAVNLVNATVDTSGVIAGDTVSINLPANGTTTGTVDTRHVDNGKAVTISALALSGSAAANYTLGAATGLKVNITPRLLTASYAGVDKVYDGTATAQVTALPVDLLAIDTGTVSVSALGLFSGGKNAGSSKAIAVSGGFLAGANRNDYELANPGGSTSASILRKDVTASYTSVLSKVYDGSTGAPASGRLAGLVGSDTVTLDQTATFADRNVGNGKAISITNLALGGGDADNYTLRTSSAIASGNITPKAITVSGLNTVLAVDRVYDGSIRVAVVVPAGVALVPQSSDIVSGDQVSIVVPASGITSGTVANKNAGSGKAVSLDGLLAGGADGGNYQIAGTAGISVTISAKPLTASYTGINRVYDGTALATVSGSAAGILGTDLVSVTGSGVFTGAGARNAGTGKAVSVQSARLVNNNGSNDDAGNYTLLNPSGSTTTADILVRPVTASYAGGSKVYDGLAGAPVSSTTGFIAGDAVGLTQTAVFTAGAGNPVARNVGSGKTISITAIQLAGGDAGNYQLTNNATTTTGSITPKPLGIDGLTGVSAQDRVYDGTRNVTVQLTTTGTLAPHAADLIAGDVVSVNTPAAGTTTGTVATKTAENNKPVTVTGLTLGGADGGNYSPAATTGVSVNITPKLLTASYAGVAKVYDGSTAATVTGSAGGIVAGDAVAIRGSGVFTGSGAKNVGSGKGIGVSSASLVSTSGANDAVNYALVNPSGTATGSITPKAVTAVYVGGTRVYDGTLAAPVTGSATGLIVGDDVALTASAVFTGANAKDAGSGKAVAVSSIALAGDDAFNYTLAGTSTATTATVTPKALRLDGLTGVTVADRVYDGTRSVAVTVASTGTIVPHASDLIAGDVVTIDPISAGLTTGTVATKDVGVDKPVTLPGLVPGGPDGRNYQVAATDGLAVTITPRLLSAVYAGISRVYDGTTAAGVTGSSADLLAGDDIAINGNGVFTGSGAKNVGSAKPISVLAANLSGADRLNYSLLNGTGSAFASITPKTLNASYTGSTRVYDGSINAPVTASLAGLIAGDSVSALGAAQFTGSGAKNVGSGKAVAVTGISLDGSDAGNYMLGSTSAITTASITPRPLRIEGITGVSATDRVYNGSTVVAVTIGTSGPVSANGSDVVPGDDVSVTLPAAGAAAGTMADKNVGSNKPVTVTGLTLAGADAGNYMPGAATGVTVNIAPKLLSASYTGVDKVYDGGALATAIASLAGTVTGDQVAVQASAVFTGAGARNVGSGKAIAITGATLASADAGNYVLASSTGSASASITPKSLAASYAGGSRVYDGTSSAPVTGTALGLVAGDSVGLTQTALFSGAGARNVGDGKAVQVSGIALQGSDAANYMLLADTANTTASITARPLSVTGLTGIRAVDRVYDGTVAVQLLASGSITVAPGLAGGGVIAGDDVTVQLPGTISAGTMADRHAGTGKAVAVTGLTLAGNDAGNYAVTGTAGVSVTIAPRPVALLGVSAVDRVYDGSTRVAIDSSHGSISGTLAGDDVRLLSAGVAGSMADKHAGAGKAVADTGLALGGSDAADYVAASASALSVNIAPRLLQASATVADRVYNGSAVAAATLVDDRVAGDAIVLASGGASFGSKDAGAGKTVTVSGITLAGADAADYRLASDSASTTATIAPAPATVAAGTLSKLYGETLTLSSGAFSASGLAAGETIGTATLASAGSVATAGVAGGPYAITISDARGGSFNPANYTLSYRNGQLTVTPRLLTVSANNVVRYADEPNPAGFGISVSVGSLVNGDAINPTLAQAAPANSAGASGGSVFQIVPAGVVFASGDPANYTLRYNNGVLVVLPTPPRIGDVDTGSGGAAPAGDVGFAVQVDLADVQRAQAELERAASVVTQLQPGQRQDRPAAAGALRTAQASAGEAATDDRLAADIGAALSGDSRRISVPSLQRLPLISFDPQLRQLIRGPAPARPRAEEPTPAAP